MSKNTQISELINYLSVDGSGNIVITGSLIGPAGATYATQSYVSTAISNLVNAAPTALDTLAELSTALNNDASFATTVTNSLAGKLNLSGGTLTGALNGTSASFSGLLTTSAGINLPVNQSINSNSGRIVLNNGSIYLGDIDGINPTGAVIIRQNGVNFIAYNNNLLTVTGAATFSSSVTAAARIQAQGSNGAGSAQGGFLINYNTNSTSSRSWLINNDINVFGDFSICQTTTQTGLTFNNPYFYINPTGNVGIGTTLPNVKFEVLDTATSSGEVARFQRNIDTINEYAYIKVGSEAYPAYFGSMLSTYDVAYISMSPNPTDKKGLYIRTTDGNVGIGTYNPLLQTNGKGLVISTDQDSFPILRLERLSGGTGGKTVTNWEFVLGSSGSLVFQHASDAYEPLIIENATPSTTLYLKNNGFVGIGSTPDYGKLSIVGTDNTVLSSTAFGSSGGGGVMTAIYNLSQSAGSFAGIKLITRNSGASFWNIVNVSIGASSGDLSFGNGTGGSGSEKMRLTNDGSLVQYGQCYSSYTKYIVTPNGGVQNCRIIEDALGQWILVGKFVANAAQAIQGVWSSVRGLSVSTSQSDATAFSADWGDSLPTEVRVLGATDFDRWRETRTIDFIYRVPTGRTWATFLMAVIQMELSILQEQIDMVLQLMVLMMVLVDGIILLIHK